MVLNGLKWLNSIGAYNMILKFLNTSTDVLGRDFGLNPSGEKDGDCLYPDPLQHAAFEKKCGSFTLYLTLLFSKNEKCHIIYHFNIFSSERQKIFGNSKHLWRYQIIEVHLSDLQGLCSDIN